MGHGNDKYLCNPCTTELHHTANDPISNSVYGSGRIGSRNTDNTNKRAQTMDRPFANHLNRPNSPSGSIPPPSNPVNNSDNNDNNSSIREEEKEEEEEEGRQQEHQTRNAGTPCFISSVSSSPSPFVSFSSFSSSTSSSSSPSPSTPLPSSFSPSTLTLFASGTGFLSSSILAAVPAHAQHSSSLTEEDREEEIRTPSSTASFASCFALASSQTTSPFVSPKPTAFSPLASQALAGDPPTFISLPTLLDLHQRPHPSLQQQQNELSSSSSIGSPTRQSKHMKAFDIPPRRSSITFQTTTSSPSVASSSFGGSSITDSPSSSYSQRPFFVTSRHGSIDMARPVYARRHMSLDIHRSSSSTSAIGSGGGGSSSSSSYTGATGLTSSASPVFMRRAGSHPGKGKHPHLVWSRPRLTFDRLPHEIKIQIFRYLSTFNLVRVTRVSRSWKTLALDGALWRVIDTTRYYRTIDDRQLLGLGHAAAGFLRYANFRGCTQLSSNTIRAIAEQCPNIRRLDLSGCRSLSSKAIADVCMNLSHLVFLNVSGLDVINNFTLQAMGVYCRELQVLNISFCRHISGSGVAKLARSCQELRDLNMAGCQGLEDRLMMVIGMSLGKLRELCMNGCHSLTDRGLLALLTGLASSARTCLAQKRCEQLTKASLKGVAAGATPEVMSMDARIQRYYRRLQNLSQDSNSIDAECLLVDDDDSDYELEPVPWDAESDNEEAGEDGERLDSKGELDIDNLSESDHDTPGKATIAGPSPPIMSNSSSPTSPALSSTATFSPPTTTNVDATNSNGSGHTRLTYLGLANCRLLTNESLFVIGDHCSRTLERLELTSCERLNDDGLIYLARHCDRLRFLDLEEVNLLTDLSLREFALRLSKLERICLSYCENVTDQGVMQLFKGALIQQANPGPGNNTPSVHRVGGSKYLVHIELDNCLLITDRLLLEFATAIEERRVQALEKWRNMEEEAKKRRAAREMSRKRYIRRLERRKGKARQVVDDDDNEEGYFGREVSQDLSGVLMTEETLVFESRRNSWAPHMMASSAAGGGESASPTTALPLARSLSSGLRSNTKYTDPLDASPSSSHPAAVMMTPSSSMIGSWPTLANASASSSSLHLPPVQASTSLSKIAIKKPRPCCVSHSSSCSLLVTTGSGNYLSSSLSSSPGTMHASSLTEVGAGSNSHNSSSSNNNNNNNNNGTCTCPCVMTSVLSMASKVQQELHSNPHIRASLKALRQQLPVPPLAWSWSSYHLHRRHKILKQRIQQRQMYYYQQVAYFQQLHQHHQQKQQQQEATRMMMDDECLFGSGTGFGIGCGQEPTNLSSSSSSSSSPSSSFNLAKQGLPPSILHRHPWMNQRRAAIQVFDCRNITLEGVETAMKKVQTRDFVIKSYYSWANPSVADPGAQLQDQQHPPPQRRNHHPLTIGALISAFGVGGGNSNNNHPIQQQYHHQVNSGTTPFAHLDFAFDYGYGFPHDEEVDEAAAEEQETTHGSPGLGSVVTATTAVVAMQITGSNGGGGGGGSTSGLTTHSIQASLHQHLQQQQQQQHMVFGHGAAGSNHTHQTGGAVGANVQQSNHRPRRRGNNPRGGSPCSIL